MNFLKEQLLVVGLGFPIVIAFPILLLRSFGLNWGIGIPIGLVLIGGLLFAGSRSPAFQDYKVGGKG